MRTAVLVGLGLGVSLSTVSGQAEPTLADVLRRAGRYVQQFHEQLSGIVAEETYLQEIVPQPTFLGTRGRRPPRPVAPERRELRSDVLLLRPSGAPTWVQFRDVFEVNGQSVRDREDRLTALFLSPNVPATERIQRIRAESARHNLGPIERTMNVPVLPIALLLPEFQFRFEFRLQHSAAQPRPTSGDPGLPSSPAFRVGVDVWTISFEERERPTVVRTTEGQDIFTRGRFWIEPLTGRVVMSELVAENRQVRGELIVSYQSEPLLGFSVPAEFREKYTQPDYRATIVGTATYSNFRRFQVQVDQSIESPERR